MKKQMLSILPISLILIFLFIPSMLAEEEAMNRLYDIIQEQRGYTREQLSVNQMEYSDGRWGFSLTIIDHPEDEDGLLVGQMDAAGRLLMLEGPQKISWDRQLENDLKACFNRDDGYLLLPKVREKWLPILDALSPEQLSRIFERYVAVVRLEISLPDPEAMPYTDAYEKALSHLADLPGWSGEQARMFRLAICAYYAPEDIGYPVYFFYFEQHSYMEDAYASDRAMGRYQEKLKRAFDGDAPRRFSIMINAVDGSLVELPVFDYVPIKYHYLDFFIRTPEIIQAAKGMT